jgi:hypothetical protein
MAWFLFVDENGHDRPAAPYEILSGVAVQDRDFFNLINALHAAEFHHCDRRYSADRNELKGRIILKTNILSHSNPNVQISPGEVQNLVKSAQIAVRSPVCGT